MNSVLENQTYDLLQHYLHIILSVKNAHLSKILLLIS